MEDNQHFLVFITLSRRAPFEKRLQGRRPLTLRQPIRGLEGPTSLSGSVQLWSVPQAKGDKTDTDGSLCEEILHSFGQELLTTGEEPN